MNRKRVEKCDPDCASRTERLAVPDKRVPRLQPLVSLAGTFVVWSMVGLPQPRRLLPVRFEGLLVSSSLHKLTAAAANLQRKNLFVSSTLNTVVDVYCCGAINGVRQVVAFSIT